jgi:hypothetical protein
MIKRMREMVEPVRANDVSIVGLLGYDKKLNVRETFVGVNATVGIERCCARDGGMLDTRSSPYMYTQRACASGR